MTTLYRPVLIESAEQAEALPDDAIVIGVETGERYTRGFEGDWWGVTEMGTSLAVDLDSGDAVTALVPIEAEDETTGARRLNCTCGERGFTPYGYEHHRLRAALSAAHAARRDEEKR